MQRLCNQAILCVTSKVAAQRKTGPVAEPAEVAVTVAGAAAAAAAAAAATAAAAAAAAVNRKSAKSSQRMFYSRFARKLPRSICICV